jgi:hypothetical protein
VLLAVNDSELAVVGQESLYLRGARRRESNCQHQYREQPAHRFTVAQRNERLQPKDLAAAGGMPSAQSGGVRLLNTSPN